MRYHPNFPALLDRELGVQYPPRRKSPKELWWVLLRAITDPAVQYAETLASSAITSVTSTPSRCWSTPEGSTMQPIRFDFAFKIAHYLQLYLGLSRQGAFDFAFQQEGEFLTEYNFGGSIGGKFRQNAGRWYVQGCSDHLTTEHKVMITLVNVKLEALKRRYDKKQAQADETSCWLLQPDVSAHRDACLEEFRALLAAR